MSATVNDAGLRALLAGLSGAVEDGTAEVAEQIRDLAEQFAPKDTGDLADSGVVEPTETGHRVVFGRDLPDPRAVIQEYGSVNQDAQPYLTPAAEQIDPAAPIARRIRDLVSRSQS